MHSRPVEGPKTMVGYGVQKYQSLPISTAMRQQKLIPPASQLASLPAIPSPALFHQARGARGGCAQGLIDLRHCRRQNGQDFKEVVPEHPHCGELHEAGKQAYHPKEIIF
eukprot:891553-Rhodomonas_salina.1